MPHNSEQLPLPWDAMKKETAEKTSLALLRISSVLDTLLHEYEEKLGEEEFIAYRKKFGEILASVYLEVLRPLWKEHPELEPEEMDGPYKVDKAVNQEVFKLIVSVPQKPDMSDMSAKPD